MTDELKQWEYDRGYEKGKADMLKVIEDIKQEIEKVMVWHSGTGEEVIQAYVDGLKKGLDIIDKHTGGEQE